MERKSEDKCGFNVSFSCFGTFVGHSSENCIQETADEKLYLFMTTMNLLVYLKCLDPIIYTNFYFLLAPPDSGFWLSSASENVTGADLSHFEQCLMVHQYKRTFQKQLATIFPLDWRSINLHIFIKTRAHPDCAKKPLNHLLHYIYSS